MATLAPPEVPIDANALESLPADLMEVFEEGDFSGVLQKAIHDLEKDHRENFIEERTPDGLAWPPLAPKTMARKGHNRILYETGRLLHSLSGLETRGDSIREIVDEGANKGFSYGTAVPYAHFHQDGTAKIPQREFAGFTEERIEQIEQDVLDRMVELLIGG